MSHMYHISVALSLLLPIKGENESMHVKSGRGNPTARKYVRFIDKSSFGD